MSAARFTPGPWLAGSLSNEILTRDGHPIAEMAIDGAGNSDVADARLISAAPDLYEAVRWMAQTIHQAHHFPELQDGLCEKAICEYARKALAKARGES